MNANNTQPSSSRRDGNATHYTYLPEAPHFIEQAVRVYLRLADDGTRWIVDGATVDGSPLYSDYTDEAAINSECVCGRPAECERIRAAADKLPLPTGEQLAQLIVDALPE
ncbi:hypothetical protein BB737_10150 [Mycobacterium avium subsp. hominissuis]|uniref:Uncharacterized protein n=2 Tax=Mycobacterium TaxID=1763 RepID=A0AA37UZN0_9MYCO|nr:MULTISPECIES: hypothetical protein [Mycobacterium]PBJ39091.1 hypothetical protein XV03_03700 [Mycobacterium avium subsp. hominissuis]PBJ65966.1 hypothetical protein BB737_10150 [Mycobacterium avium subsp. hominissuis]GLB86446.1 hypothetical protein SRL2020028_57020 [Mycobacterium kiyosense]